MSSDRQVSSTSAFPVKAAAKGTKLPPPRRNGRVTLRVPDMGVVAVIVPDTIEESAQRIS